jgi:hypothetical protein
MGEAILASVFGAVASSVVGGLLTKKPSTPAAPAVTPPTVMPDPLAQKQKQRRAAAKVFGDQLTAANTILTNEDKLGA